MTRRITIWNENVDEAAGLQEVLAVHPGGIHGTLADILSAVEGARVRTATLQQPELGLGGDVLEDTDVLVWWGHKAHDQVPDALVERIRRRALSGMGLILLHSAINAKITERLLGTSQSMGWRHDVYERLFCVCPGHPITQGVPDVVEVGMDECYAEPCDIPAPDELLYLAWFASGHVFRAGCTWRRGNGNIFYFQPGHETNRAFHHPHICRILQNACRWAMPGSIRVCDGPWHIDAPLPEGS